MANQAKSNGKSPQWGLGILRGAVANSPLTDIDPVFLAEVVNSNTDLFKLVRHENLVGSLGGLVYKPVAQNPKRLAAYLANCRTATEKALAKAEAAVGAMPTPSPGVSAMTISAARKKADCVVSNAFTVLNRRQAVWAKAIWLIAARIIEDQEARFAAIVRKPQFVTCMLTTIEISGNLTFAGIFGSTQATVSNVVNWDGSKMSFRGKLPPEAKAARRAATYLDKACHLARKVGWPIGVYYSLTGNKGKSPPVLEAILPKEVAGPLMEANVDIDRLIGGDGEPGLSNEEILAIQGIGPAGLEKVRQVVYEPVKSDPDLVRRILAVDVYGGHVDDRTLEVANVDPLAGGNGAIEAAFEKAKTRRTERETEEKKAREAREKRRKKPDKELAAAHQRTEDEYAEGEVPAEQTATKAEVPTELVVEANPADAPPKIDPDRSKGEKRKTKGRKPKDKVEG